MPYGEFLRSTTNHVVLKFWVSKSLMNYFSKNQCMFFTLEVRPDLFFNLKLKLKIRSVLVLDKRFIRWLCFCCTSYILCVLWLLVFTELSKSICKQIMCESWQTGTFLGKGGALIRTKMVIVLKSFLFNKLLHSAGNNAILPPLCILLANKTRLPTTHVTMMHGFSNKQDVPFLEWQFFFRMWRAVKKGPRDIQIEKININPSRPSN